MTWSYFLFYVSFPEPSFIARLYLLLELYQIYFMTDMNRVPEVVITPRYLRRLACVWSLELLNEFKIDRNRWNFCRVLINLVGFTLAKPVIVWVIQPPSSPAVLTKLRKRSVGFILHGTFQATNEFSLQRKIKTDYIVHFIDKKGLMAWHMLKE